MKFLDTLIGFTEGLRLKEQQRNLQQGGGFYAPESFTRLYLQDWMARKVVEIPPEDMVRRWRNWKADDDQITAIEDAETAMQVKDRVKQALIWARLYGGSIIVIADGAPMEQPLNPEGVRRDDTIRLLTFSRARVSATGNIIVDPLNELFGMPERFTIGARQVHASRVIVFKGRPYVDDRSVDVTQFSLTESFWGSSVLAPMQYALANAQRSQTAFAQLIEEAKIDIVSVTGLGDKVSTQQDLDNTLRRWNLFAEGKSLSGVGLLEKDEETYDQKQVTFTDAPEIISTYLQIIAAAADIPVTRMLGRSPAGMNATGESDVRNYYDMIQAMQENELRPALGKLDEIIIRRALGNRPEEIWYEWASLWNISDQERATIAKTKAETTAIYASLGVMMPETLAKATLSQLVDDGVYPGLEQALEEEEVAREAGLIPEEPEDPEAEPDDDDEALPQAAE